MKLFEWLVKNIGTIVVIAIITLFISILYGVISINMRSTYEIKFSESCNENKGMPARDIEGKMRCVAMIGMAK